MVFEPDIVAMKEKTISTNCGVKLHIDSKKDNEKLLIGNTVHGHTK
jgi:hypothetical protein